MSGDIPIPFDNSYARLPERFFVRQAPVPVDSPGLVAVNHELALELGFNDEWLGSNAAVSVFAGNEVPEGAEPLAQAYAGHQFGVWVPQLGDGRALLLGEVVDRCGRRHDIQLKGAGRTPWSRGGDGRAWLGPVLREYVVSEAMHALGIPTTRALAAVVTGEAVVRNGSALPGAILTRVADSHLRIGTFQYFAARQDDEAIRLLVDYAIARHYPDAETPLDLLERVVERQASLIAHWMSVGFVHGVMNTDNTSIAGETIDYGPCAFMDTYHPETVFSSIDSTGRYAYGNQPAVMAWNLARFASCLLPLMGERNAAIVQATEVVQRFPDIYARERLRLFGYKIGLEKARASDVVLIERFLQGLQEAGTDFTNSFRELAKGRVPACLADWKKDWLARLKEESGDSSALIRRSSPAYIPRNHRIEAMIDAALCGDFEPFRALSAVLLFPCEEQIEHAAYSEPPRPGEAVIQTFCGT